MKIKAPLAELVGDQLRRTGLTLATAESCTGGLLGNLITDVPGASDYYLGGVVAYANAAKITLLGVPPDVISRYGAVSEETVRWMAVGIRKILGSGVSLSISGIAGPTGGTKDKPVGTVWIGLSSSLETRVYRYHFSGNREKIKLVSAETALHILLEHLQQEPDKKPVS